MEETKNNKRINGLNVITWIIEIIQNNIQNQPETVIMKVNNPKLLKDVLNNWCINTFFIEEEGNIIK